MTNASFLARWADQKQLLHLTGQTWGSFSGMTFLQTLLSAACPHLDGDVLN